MSSKSPFPADQVAYPPVSVCAPRRHDAIASVLDNIYGRAMGSETPQDMMALLAELDRVGDRQHSPD